MDQRPLQGWHADVFGFHEYRYFSAGLPTKLVRDGDVESYDELPEGEFSPDDIAVQASASPVPGDAATAGYPIASYPGVPASRQRTGRVNVIVALIAAAAVVAFVLIEGGLSRTPTSRAGSGPTGADLAAYVTASAKGTLAQKTADVTVTGTGEVNGTTVSLRGTGQVDFTANAEKVSISTSISGAEFSETEIATSHALYLQASTNGQSMAQYLGGKHWVKVPFDASWTTSTPQDSPAWSLEVLQQQGASVVALGTQKIGGLTCNAYAVTPSPQAMIAAAQHEWAQLGLSNSETAAAQQQLAKSIPPAITVWIDPTRQLLCQVDVSMQLSMGPSAGSGGAPATDSIQMLMTFTHYGVPVHITSPPQSDTVSF